MSPTNIEWADETWNPIVGCSRVSAGCDHCYAIRQAHRFYCDLTQKTSQRLDWNGRIQFFSQRLDGPLKWRKPRRIFVCSMSDLFHHGVEHDWLLRIIKVFYDCPQHTFMLLTRRPERAASLSDDLWRSLPNVWLGVSVEDQATADERIVVLLRCPAALHWVSYEPALGPLDLTRYLAGPVCGDQDLGGQVTMHMTTGIQWVVAGGESGPRARRHDPGWFRSVRDQCQEAKVPFFFKQWGEWAPANVFQCLPRAGCGGRIAEDETMTKICKKHAGRVLDGHTWDQFPRRVWEPKDEWERKLVQQALKDSRGYAPGDGYGTSADSSGSVGDRVVVGAPYMGMTG